MANRRYESVDERILSNIVRVAELMVGKPQWIRRPYLRHSIGTITGRQLNEVVKRHKIRTGVGSNGVTTFNVEDARNALCRILDARLEQKRKGS